MLFWQISDEKLLDCQTYTHRPRFSVEQQSNLSQILVFLQVVILSIDSTQIICGNIKVPSSINLPHIHLNYSKFNNS